MEPVQEAARDDVEVLLGCGQMGSTLNGAAAKVMLFDRLGKKARPGPFWKIKVIRLTGVPKKSLCQKKRNLQRPH